MRRRLLDPETSSYEIPLRCSRHSRWRLGGTGTGGGGGEEGGGVRWSRERVGSVLNPRPVEGEKAAAPGQCKTTTRYRDTGQNSLHSKEADSRTTAAGRRRGNNRHGDGAHTSICLVFGIACSVHFTSATTSLHLLVSHLGLLLLLGLVLGLRVGAALLVLSG